MRRRLSRIQNRRRQTRSRPLILAVLKPRLVRISMVQEPIVPDRLRYRMRELRVGVGHHSKRQLRTAAADIKVIHPVVRTD